MTGSFVTERPLFSTLRAMSMSAFERDAQPHLQAEPEREALVHQRGQAHLPAVVDLAEHLRLVHAHVVEEDLVELRVAGDLLERLHRHAGRLHVEQEVRDALVLRRVGIGAREQHHPVGDVRERRPHLLAVDHVVVAVLHRPRLQRGQVGAGVRLGVALAPDLLAGEDLRGIPLLLRLGPVRDDRGPGHADAEDVEHRRRLRDRHLLVQDHLLHEREALAAVLLRPREPDEAGVVERVLPAAQELVGLGARDVGRADLRFQSTGLLALSQARTRSRNASCSGVSVKSTFPSWTGRRAAATRLNGGSF